MQNHGVRLMHLFCCLLMGVVMLPRRRASTVCEQRLMLSRWSEILLGARDTALARKNADFSDSWNGPVDKRWETTRPTEASTARVEVASPVRENRTYW
jgi:hypothetical protein